MPASASIVFSTLFNISHKSGYYFFSASIRKKAALYPDLLVRLIGSAAPPRSIKMQLEIKRSYIPAHSGLILLQALNHLYRVSEYLTERYPGYSLYRSFQGEDRPNCPARYPRSNSLTAIITTGLPVVMVVFSLCTQIQGYRY